MSASSSGAGEADQSLLFKLLSREHDEAVEQLRELGQASTADERIRSRESLRATLEHHIAAEEDVLYSALRRVGSLDSFIDRMCLQHGKIREALDALDEVEPGNAAEEEAEYLGQVLAEHVDEEENRLFAYATEYLAGDLESLAVEMEEARQRERGAFGV